MSGPPAIEKEFLDKLVGIILENLSNEQFGVSELAARAGMSRSNLLRKIKKLTGISASQYIRQVRLEQAMELLKQGSANVSEVTWQVGFNSTSYFIKCFREHYGYPPGEVGKKLAEGTASEERESHSAARRNYTIPLVVAGILIILIAVFLLWKPSSAGKKELEKSIAVLPFINDSDDSSNVHIINGLMESILNDLQKIEDLRVVSRTSVEKYRNAQKTIPEMGKELNVNYFVEGSGQKEGNRILLHIQLIEAKTDRHLWAREYQREIRDIFSLQNEVAKSIASEIKAIITPEEEERIDRKPTEDLEAYEYFLKGRELFYSMERGNMLGAVHWFRKAIQKDNEFALAYADAAIAYYLEDMNRVEKQYVDSINYFADKALLYDAKLAQSLVAKALYHMNIGENEMAVPYLEKALEYNPNSALVINILSEFYTNYSPDSEKYLEYALRGIRLDIAARDSVTASFILLHVSNALVQNGFVDEAEKYIVRSLQYNPQNLFSQYVKAYILYAQHQDLEIIKKMLVETLRKDTTRLDVLQETAKICYYMRDWEEAYHYYKKFIDKRDAQQLDIYRSEDAKIGLVLEKTGHHTQAEEYFDRYRQYAENDNSIYKHLSLSVYHAYRGDREQAIRELDLFADQEHYHYWTLLFLKIDPLIDNIKDVPGYKRALKNVEKRFWDHHDKLQSSLKNKNLL